MSGNRIDYILLSPDLAAGTVASSILPLNHHMVSDHRASYCDIDVQSLFSVKHVDELTNRTRRKLDISKPSVVKKYLDKLEMLFTEHKILQRVLNLVCQLKNSQTHDYTDLIIQFNKLDEEKIGTCAQLNAHVIGPLPKAYINGPLN